MEAVSMPQRTALPSPMVVKITCAISPVVIVPFQADSDALLLIVLMVTGDNGLAVVPHAETQPKPELVELIEQQPMVVLTVLETPLMF